jgi:murein DD-endopeptidase MepM/ murein hydrolase activator NlpD
LQLIVVSDDHRFSRSLVLTWKHWVALAFAGLVLFVGLTMALNFVSLRYAAATNHPLIRTMLLADQRAEAARNQQYLQDHLSALAIKVGELQANMTRLEGLGEKLAKVAGLSPKELPTAQPAGRGGARSLLPEKRWTLGEFREQLNDLTRSIDLKGDQLSVLEAMLVEDSAQRKFLPSLMPVEGAGMTSNFGYRIDPFSGAQAMHDGVDFSSPTGTPILASASGKVVKAETESGYGQVIDVDHGNGLVTRYAHASKLLAKEGDLVVRGQVIAEVGSTGRSTAPHLHFEVRLNGVPQNPAKFLKDE